jgi:hypothetical protein
MVMGVHGLCNRFLGYNASKPVLSVRVLEFDIALAGISKYGAIKHAKVRIEGLTTQFSSICVSGFKDYTDWYEGAAPSPPIPGYGSSEPNVLVGAETSTERFRALFFIDIPDEQISADKKFVCLLTCQMGKYSEADEPLIVGLVLRDVGNGEWARIGTFQTRGVEIRSFHAKRELVLV